MKRCFVEFIGRALGLGQWLLVQKKKTQQQSNVSS